MQSLKKTVAFLLFFSPFLVSSQMNAVDAANPIDSIYQVCLDSSENVTTVGMIHCSSRSQSLWDSSMNKYYNLLLEILSTDQRDQLRIAQKEWLKFRDKEFELASRVYLKEPGTMWQVIYAKRKMDVVRTRALELQDYYDMKTMK